MAAAKAWPHWAPLIPSIFSTLIFYGDPSRTAADISAPSDRHDECELIGLMIFLPHFPPLYGCSMVHGADGWKQLTHTHTRTLPNFNSLHIKHTPDWEEDAHKLLCIHYFSQMLSHMNLHSGVPVGAPMCTIEHWQVTNEPCESCCWLSELLDGAHWSLTLIAIFCNCRNRGCTSLKSKCTRQKEK